MKIALGGDHSGYLLKKTVIAAVASMGHEVTDYGCYDANPVDFTDITREVCLAVLEKKVDRAILVSGMGIGSCMAANKIPGIRAAVCHDIHTAHQCIAHDNVTVMCLGGKILGPELACDLIERYLLTQYKGGEAYERRIEKLRLLEIEFAKKLLDL